MTFLVIPPEQILAEIARTYHSDNVGTDNGFAWHRATRTTPCLPCRDAHNRSVNAVRRSPEFQRLLDAGVNYDTAMYLARVVPKRRAKYERSAA